MNKKIYSTIFIIFFTFSHCHGMHHNASMFNLCSNGLQNFTKNHPFMVLATTLGIPTLFFLIYTYTLYAKENDQQKKDIPDEREKTEEKYFWLITKDGEKFKLTQTEACKYDALKIYMQYFCHKNTEKTPLAIGCQESLKNLQGEQFTNFLDIQRTLNFAIKKLTYATCVSEKLTLFHTSDPDRLIAQKALALEHDSKLSFVLDQIIKLNYIDNEQTLLERDAPKTIYTLDQKFYYIIKPRYDDKIVKFYNSNNVKVLQFEFNVPFQLTHKKNIIIFQKNRRCDKNNTIFYDLDNESTMELPIPAEFYALSHNDQYLIFTNNYKIYVADISDLPRFTCDFLFDETARSKIYFSPLDKELISISRDTIIKYNIENIKKITNKIIYSVDNESKFNYIELSPDEKHVAIDEYSFCTILNIDNPTKKITLTTKSGRDGHYCLFAYQTPFICSKCPTETGKNIICDFYDQNGNHLHTTIAPKIEVSTSKSFCSLDLNRLMPVFQNTLDNLSKIQANLTTQQLICLQTLCAHQRKPYTNITLQETDPTKKSFETFTKEHQTFLQEKLLLSYS